MEQILSPSDHDLLIQISVTQSSMREEMRQSNTQYATQLSDHEARIRVMEKHEDRTAGTSQGITSTWKIVMAVLGLMAAIVEPIIMVYLGTNR